MTESDTQSTDQDRGPKRPPYQYYALLIGVYQALFAGFLVIYRRRSTGLDRISGLDLTMLGLATLRMSKVISEDEISTVVREPIIEHDGTEQRPRGTGMRWALGKLILCPTCTGTWVAAFLGYALHLYPRQTRPLLAIMSASSIEQFSDAVLSLVYTDRNVLRRHENAPE